MASPRPGIILVPSKSRPGLEHQVNVGGLTCSCEHFTLSGRKDRERHDHIAMAVTRDGFIPLPTGDWVEVTPEIISVLLELAAR